MEKEVLWKKFNRWYWGVALIQVAGGGVAMLVTSFLGEMPEESLGSILLNFISYFVIVIPALILPLVLAYFAWKIRGSIWYGLFGIFAIGGLLVLPTFIIGYLIVLVLYKKPEKRLWPLLKLVALAILLVLILSTFLD